MESESHISPLLALAAIAAVFAALSLAVLIELPRAEGLRATVSRHAQKAMFVVAAAAMASSLYYSQVVGFIPCELCWFQRIAMYPLAVLLAVTLVSRSRLDARYVATLALIGLPISIYHYQLQLLPEQNTVCSGIVACTDKNVDQFGFVTIPFMAGCGFLTILVLQIAEWRVKYLARGERE
jgi:disulfide bond formation protein DsbB